MLFGNDFNPQAIVMMLPGVLMGFTFHEFAHAWTATLFGDDTPRLQGRVTLSPLAHLDWLGTMLLLIGGWGWAKPVMVNTSKLRPRVFGDIMVSLAGVLMNFLIAIVFYSLYLLGHNGLLFGYNNPVLNETFWQIVRINVILVGFNLIPIPPLDGFHVARYLFPPSMSEMVNTLYRFGPFLLVILVVSGAATRILGPIYIGILHAVDFVVVPVLRLFFT